MKTIFLTAITLFSISAWAEVDEIKLMADTSNRVAQMLGNTESEVVFLGLRVSTDKLGTFVCGTANGKKFVHGPVGRNNEPTLEGKFSKSLFDMVWNSRCAGMSDAESITAFNKDAAEEVCGVKQWNWVTWGTKSIQIQGLASCTTGRILVKAFEGDEYLGSGEGNIEAKAFTVYIDRRPMGSGLRIEAATSK